MTFPRCLRCPRPVGLDLGRAAKVVLFSHKCAFPRGYAISRIAEPFTVESLYLVNDPAFTPDERDGGILVAIFVTILVGLHRRPDLRHDPRRQRSGRRSRRRYDRQR